MKYLSQINALITWQFNNGILPDGEYRLYMTLMHCMNQQHWEERAPIPNGTIKFLSNINNDTKLKRYRDGLISKGLIKYDKKLYIIPKLYRDENESGNDTKLLENPTEKCKEKRSKNVSKSVSKSVSPLLDKDKDQDIDKSKGARKKKSLDDVLETVKDSRVLLALQDFVAHRKGQGKPLTAYALERSIELLYKLGGGDVDTMCRIVEQTILRNWQSFYELKNDYQNVNRNVSQNDSSCMIPTEGIGEIEAAFMQAYER